MAITLAYATIPEMKEYLQQVAGDNTNDKVLGKALARATDIEDKALGFPNGGAFGKYDVVTEELSGDYTQGSQVVVSYGTPYLVLPYHQIGQPITVTNEAGTLVDASYYTEQADGTLYAVNSLLSPYYYRGGHTGWPPGRYTVTAKWGYGAPPEAIKEVCLELAVNIFRGRDRGMWTDVIGVEGSGGLRFTGGLTNQQQAIIKAVRAQYGSPVVFA